MKRTKAEQIIVTMIEKRKKKDDRGRKISQKKYYHR